MAGLISLLAFIIFLIQDVPLLIVELLELLKALLNPTGVLTEQNLSLIAYLLMLYLPWLVLTGLLRLFIWLIKRAKKRKSGVIILLSFFQMFLPDPYAERTIKTVQVQKKKEVKTENTPKDRNKQTDIDLE
ncbi:MAG: hypothetical protein OQJ89_12720 [Kangiellaceae bacterium]|nr:hypothetical protein [Kangiellaceae bacterium]MCW9017825.1 hypothetical protein [Kangiellaceae bacterium]